MTEMERTGG